MQEQNSAMTPMMKQYLQTKEEYPDCILFYRLGDFYEMFFEDAILVSKELEIALTGKSCGLDERAPMCGVPYHAAEVYLNRLIQKGYKVAICEQVEDPKFAKGLVRREVVRIVTPGTNMNVDSLDETSNNYLLSVYYTPQVCGIAVTDITTFDFYVTQVENPAKMLDEIDKYSPIEIIGNEALTFASFATEDWALRRGTTIHALLPHYYDEATSTRLLLSHFEVASLQALSLDAYPAGAIAAGALIMYLYETQKSDLKNLKHLKVYTATSYMLLDMATRRNLELMETLRDKQKKGSLLGVLDRTKTAMGARYLKQIMERPFIDKQPILNRQNAIAFLCKENVTRDEIREYLSGIYDLQRIISKLSYSAASARDLLSLKQSISILPAIRSLLVDRREDILSEITMNMDPLEDLCDLLEQSINEEAPHGLREGGIVRDGYHMEVDRLRKSKSEGKQWLANLEAKDRERTGIKNLKVKYNKVFGFYFEVTNSYANLVPADYVRKQTMAGAERYTSDELKELEDTILHAEDRLNVLEYELFSEIKRTILDATERILATATAVAELDMICSLSFVAERNHYTRPNINEKGIIDIRNGRHPVVETMIDHDLFVANDIYLDNQKHTISVITGPNMAGKSTYMRQTALIVLMAQLGSFVPAESANIGIVDRIFTRVGASDDLASGQSTFMVEMNEVANILRNATSKSLLILDEIGRGTSTFDGLSIAWSVIEYISQRKLLGAKTLFATHYHELTELEGLMDNVHNYCIAVKEKGEDIVFLRKIIPGSADKSYGIQVARIAGVPELVIARAREIADYLSEHDLAQVVSKVMSEKEPSKVRKKEDKHDELTLAQISLFDAVPDQEILQQLKSLEISNMTPMEALNRLHYFQSLLVNRW